MVKSMTGFGKRSGAVGNKNYTVEVKALNSKFLDIYLKIPSTFRNREIEIRNNFTHVLLRGKIEMLIESESGVQKLYSINRDLFAAYYTELDGLTRDFNLPKNELLGAIMNIPDILQSERENINEEEWAQMSALIEQAIEELNNFRLDEGKKLEEDLADRVRQIKEQLTAIEAKESGRKTRIKDRLSEKLDEARELAADKNRLEQEIIYYIEKLDITEEIVRLKSHCEYFTETLAEKVDEKGKKLAFITQEMGREINTIGAKSYNAELQKLVVLMKEQLEKIKEQVSNVL